MSLNVSGPGGQFQGVSSSQSAGGAGQVKGEWNGAKVSVANNPMSLLADAAEEMTFAASEKFETKLAKRKKPEEHKPIVVAPPPEALREMQGAMKERLANLKKDIEAGRGNPAAFGQALEKFGGDAADRHAAMLWLEEEFAGQPSLAAMARRERERLTAESGREIQAGYNIHGVDAPPGGAEAGRRAYADALSASEGVGPLLDAVLAKAKGEDFSDTVAFLSRAAGADLSAANPSTEKSELEELNNRLYYLRAIGNFTKEFADDIGALRKDGGKAPLPDAGVGTLKTICKAKDQRPVMLDPLKATLRLEDRRDPTYDVKALTRSFKLAHQLPEKLFADQDSRQRVLAAVQKMLDAAIDLEDELGE